MSIGLWIPDEVAAVSWALPMAAGTAAIVSPWGRRLAWRVGAIDHPDARKIHRHPTPRLGGLSAAVALLVCAGLWFAADPTASQHCLRCRGLLPGAAIMLAIGLLDDLYRLGPRVKLIFQIMAAVIMWLGGVRIEVLEGPLIPPVPLGALGPVITVLWIVGVTNAINFLDGLDGLAGGTAALASASFLLIASHAERASMLGVLCASQIGACAVLVVNNVRSPKSFLGDSGSLLLGVMVAVTGILASQNAHTGGTRLCLPAIALAVPLIDLTACVARRLLSGRSVLSADRGHIHHMLLSSGFSANAAAAILCIATAALGTLAATAAHTPPWVEAGALAVILIAAAIVYRRLGYLSLRLWLYGRRANRTIRAAGSRAGRGRTKNPRPCGRANPNGADDPLPERLQLVLSRIRRARRALGIDYIRVQREASGAPGQHPSDPIIEWGTRPDNVITTQLCGDGRYASEGLTVTLGERRTRGPGRLHAKEMLMAPLLADLAMVLSASPAPPEPNSSGTPLRAASSARAP
ncbi:MAG: glycosyltransferase family 4 protein [Phycisphaerae bacterium]